MGASDPEGIVVPRVILPPVDWTLGIELPEFDEPEYPRIKGDERSPDALREFFARLNNFLSGQGDAEVKKMNAERWARVDAVREPGRRPRSTGTVAALTGRPSAVYTSTRLPWLRNGFDRRFRLDLMVSGLGCGSEVFMPGSH